MTRESLDSLKKLLIPIMLEHLQNVPIPRIEGVSGKYDYVIDDLLFSGYDILPDHVSIKIKSDLQVHLKDLSTHDFPEYDIILKMYLYLYKILIYY